MWLAAIYDGYDIKKSEIHGMSQRGGSVESHLRFGVEICSPLVPVGLADFLVSFYKEEHDRMLHFLNKKGIDLIDFLATSEKKVKDKRLINTYLLGVLSRYLPISEKSWLKAIENVFTRLFAENEKVFFMGREEK